MQVEDLYAVLLGGLFFASVAVLAFPSVGWLGRFRHRIPGVYALALGGRELGIHRHVIIVDIVAIIVIFGVVASLGLLVTIIVVKAFILTRPVSRDLNAGPRRGLVQPILIVAPAAVVRYLGCALLEFWVRQVKGEVIRLSEWSAVKPGRVEPGRRQPLFPW